MSGITNQPPDLLPGTLDMLILRTLTAARCTATASPSVSAWCRRTCCRSARARCIRRCSVCCSTAGSAASGARRRTTAAPATTPHRRGRKRLDVGAQGIPADRRGHPAGPRDGVTVHSQRSASRVSLLRRNGRHELAEEIETHRALAEGSGGRAGARGSGHAASRRARQHDAGARGRARCVDSAVGRRASGRTSAIALRALLRHPASPSWPSPRWPPASA